MLLTWETAIASSFSEQMKEHRSGEELHPLLPSCPRGHRPCRCGRPGRWGAADPGRRDHRSTAPLKAELATWRKPSAVHDPGKITNDLALSLTLGRDRLVNLGLLRAEPGVYSNVTSEARICRTMGTLAADADPAVRAISRARAAAGARVWVLAGTGLLRSRSRGQHRLQHRRRPHQRGP